jgi:hypothetical protein
MERIGMVGISDLNVKDSSPVAPKQQRQQEQQEQEGEQQEQQQKRKEQQEQQQNGPKRKQVRFECLVPSEESLRDQPATKRPSFKIHDDGLERPSDHYGLCVSLSTDSRRSSRLWHPALDSEQHDLLGQNCVQLQRDVDFAIQQKNN